MRASTATHSESWQSNHLPEPRWLTRRFLDAAHEDQLLQHGGASGIRDENALESALARPRNRWLYEPECDIAQLSATYAYGLATSHCYVDGNKRTAFVALYTFLGLNGLELTASQFDTVLTMLAVAEGTLREDALAAWVRRNTEPG